MNAPAGSIPMYGGLEMRFVRPSDEDFVLDMFMAARPWFNWAGLERDALRAMYEHQQHITRLGNGMVYPEHMAFIVEKTGQAVGHLVVDLNYHDWRITQLEIHPEARGKGIGSDIMRSLQAAAGGNMMPISVSTTNQQVEAIRFYVRHGFKVFGEQPPVLHFAWMPPGRTFASTRFNGMTFS